MDSNKSSRWMFLGIVLTWGSLAFASGDVCEEIFKEVNYDSTLMGKPLTGLQADQLITDLGEAAVASKPVTGICEKYPRMSFLYPDGTVKGREDCRDEVYFYAAKGPCTPYGEVVYLTTIEFSQCAYKKLRGSGPPEIFECVCQATKTQQVFNNCQAPGSSKF